MHVLTTADTQKVAYFEHDAYQTNQKRRIYRYKIFVVMPVCFHKTLTSGKVGIHAQVKQNNHNFYG